MLFLWTSNSLENLAGALARRLSEHAAGPGLDLGSPASIVVPNRNVATFAKLQVARHIGVAAHLAIDHWEAFLGRLLEGPPGAAAPERLLTRRAVTALLASVLADPQELERSGAEDVRAYLRGERPGERDLHAYQLAERLSTLFEEYQLGRPEMVAAWREGHLTLTGADAATERWQSALWRRLFGPGGWREEVHAQGAARWVLPGEVAEALGERTVALPRRLHVFGFSYLPRGYLALLSHLAGAAEVYVYAFAPVRAPVEPGDELHLALRMWGKPGLEHARLLAELKPDHAEALFAPVPAQAPAAAPAARAAPKPARTAAERARRSRQLPDGSVQLTLFGSDEPARSAPAAPPRTSSAPASFLARLRADIEAGRPPAPSTAADLTDRSLTILACPGIQREVEVVAGTIWTLLREDSARGATPPLRFNDIAIIVADTARFDVYQSHIRAVFQDMYAIPTSVSDAKPASSGRVLEAVELLIALPEGQFRRPELLRLLAHPALLARYGRTDAEDWKRWCERTAIYFGADRSDLAGLYIDRDLLSWDQGLKRLALGAFLAPAPGGGAEPFPLGDQLYLPEALRASELESAALLTMLVRALVAEARHARSATSSLAEWARHYTRLVSTYLGAADEADEMLLARARRALGQLAELDLSGRPIPGRIAAEMAREALSRVPGGRGHYLADGVVVSSLQPMRPIPFPVAFVLGLGEGCFPGADGLDALDLRRGARQPGDVTARERDQYLFLEALVSTTQRLTLSYVSRDAQTGEESNPSSVVEELLWMVQQGYYGGQDPRPALVERHPLRRWNEDSGPARLILSPRAHREAALSRLDRPALAALPRRQRVELLRADPEAAWRWLGLVPLPAPAGAAAPARIELPLLALRRFLECPLQGWARAVLRLIEEDVADVVAREDEPFATDSLPAAILLGEVFRTELARDAAALTPASLDRAFDAAAARAELSGALPTGPFGRAERRRLRATLQNWRVGAAWLNLTGPVEPVRFGRADEGARVGDIHQAITLELTDPQGRPQSVALYGQTQALNEEATVSVRAILRSRVVLADHLGAWIDHVALAASGRGSGEAMTSAVLSGQAKLKTATFAPLTRDAARTYLSLLVSEMLWTTHAYFLPIEAAERFHKEKGAEDLRDSCEELRHNAQQAVRSDRGPVPHPRSYEPPRENEARAMVRRRLAPFLSSLPVEEAVEPPPDAGEDEP